MTATQNPPAQALAQELQARPLELTSERLAALMASYQPTSARESHKYWSYNETADFVPDERQSMLMKLVQDALDAGMYYTNDVCAHVAAALKLSPEALAQGATRVENGDFGMDLYYARRALDARKRFQALARHDAEMHLQEGDVVGTAIFSNDYKVNTGLTVTKVLPDARYELQGRRGAYTVSLAADATAIRYAIERAAKRGNRKTSYEQFVASRAAPVAPPADTALETARERQRA